MSVTAIASQPGMSSQAGAMMERSAAQLSDTTGASGPSAAKQVHISFSPSSAASGSTPMDRVGTGIMDTLRNFEQTRAQSRSSMNTAKGGPASPVSVAKEELLAGPASIRPSAGGEISSQPAQEVGVEDAVDAMMRSFDYAIETQLIVKTGSQFSSSASSLMRGQ